MGEKTDFFYKYDYSPCISIIENKYNKVDLAYFSNIYLGAKNTALSSVVQKCCDILEYMVSEFTGMINKCYKGATFKMSDLKMQFTHGKNINIRDVILKVIGPFFIKRGLSFRCDECTTISGKNEIVSLSLPASAIISLAESTVAEKPAPKVPSAASSDSCRKRSREDSEKTLILPPVSEKEEKDDGKNKRIKVTPPKKCD